MDDVRLYSFPDVLCITPDLAVKVALNSHFHWKVCFEIFMTIIAYIHQRNKKLKRFQKEAFL